MQHRSLPKPFDLSIHFPSKHKPKHLQITQNRPKGVSKSRREIPLNKQVTIHSTSITKERNKEQEPPAEENRAEQEQNAEESSYKVPSPCWWLRVMIHVIHPEIFWASEIHGSINTNPVWNWSWNCDVGVNFKRFDWNSFWVWLKSRVGNLDDVRKLLDYLCVLDSSGQAQKMWREASNSRVLCRVFDILFSLSVLWFVCVLY